jgi:hypothetical protein
MKWYARQLHLSIPPSLSHTSYGSWSGRGGGGSLGTGRGGGEASLRSTRLPLSLLLLSPPCIRTDTTGALHTFLLSTPSINPGGAFFAPSDRDPEELGSISQKRLAARAPWTRSRRTTPPRHTYASVSAPPPTRTRAEAAATAGQGPRHPTLLLQRTYYHSTPGTGHTLKRMHSTRRAMPQMIIRFMRQPRGAGNPA